MTGVSAIGFNPLGTLGLGAPGAFGSYDQYMPSMMGYNYGMGMNPMMMGMYAPQFMGQMAQVQQQIEANQLQHAGAMNRIKNQMAVQQEKSNHSSMIQKLLVDGEVQTGIRALRTKIFEKDQKGVCQEFDKLLGYVYNTYKNELTELGDGANAKANAIRIIETTYQNLNNSGLQDDINQHCESSMENGFNKAFKGGHTGMTRDDVLCHVYGTRIDGYSGKQIQSGIGSVFGHGARVIKHGVMGAAAGVGAYTIAKGAVSCTRKVFGKGLLRFKPAQCGKWAFIAAATAAVADIAWKVCSKD